MNVPISGHGARLTIDLGAIQRNYRALCARSGSSRVGAAVKGNGYGCGASDVVPALAAEGCKHFFVAQPVEGAIVRGALVNRQAQIFILNGFSADDAALFLANGLIAVIGSVEEFKAWLALDKEMRPPAAIHVDTGMNRLGLRYDDTSLAQLIDSLEPVLLMTHMACADELDHPLNVKQIERFNALAASQPDIPSSLANSASILNGWAPSYALARPGIALYGGGCTVGVPNPMEQVARVEARIAQIRTVEPGEAVGYSATWVAERTSRIGILSIGYADGYVRASSTGNAYCAINGVRYPFAGRVSMDLIAVDLTDAPEVQPGDWVELFGETIHLDEVADWSGTIPYEVLTRLGPRFDRRVINSET